MSFNANRHLDPFNVSPFPESAWNTFHIAAYCSSKVAVAIRISSWMTWACGMWDIICRNASLSSLLAGKTP